MKKFLLYIASLIICLILIDILFGVSCNYFNSHAIGGDTRSHYYIANECNEEVLIFGSSRAIHHYVPEILQDSLALSVYNCGTDGNGIVFMYARLLMITERYIPKMIVYDLSNFDFENDDNIKYLKWLKRFYYKPEISSVFNRVSPSEKYKMVSNLYRYNTNFIQMASDCFHPLQTIANNGYKPLYGAMEYEPKIEERKTDLLLDPLKEEFLSDFVLHCKKNGIALIFTISPAYGQEPFAYAPPAKKFCEENDVPILDYYCMPEVSSNKNLFKDSSHLNDDGAHLYTSFISEKIKLLNILP